MSTTLIVPGLHDSGPDHWQTWLEDRIAGASRVRQRDWRRANLAEWAGRVRREISRSDGRVFIVAHSFGVLAAAQAAADHEHRIAGALFVAPAEPELFGVSAYLPAEALPFPSVMVASANDPWMSFDRVAHWAGVWDSDLVNLGDAGHVNGDSGFGPWPDGLAILQRLRRDARRLCPGASRGSDIGTTGQAQVGA